MYKWEYLPLVRSDEPVVEHCPLLLPDIHLCMDCLKSAINTGALIAVVGDYDADGFLSSNILRRSILDVGGNVHVHIPERSEGYGLNERQVNLVHSLGAKVLVCIDNGSSAFAGLRRAEELGLEVVIIDHHNIPDESRINVTAFVNPKRSDSKYPFKEVCATLLAYKVASLLYEMYGFPSDYAVDRFQDLVAIGTIGDQMPIVGENRRIVIDGLKKANNDPSLHVKALGKSMKVDNVDIKSVGFNLVPALNATSRLGNAQESFSFLSTNGKSAIEKESKLLFDRNEERKKKKQDALQNMVVERPDFPVIYYHSDALDHGLLGIIASSLVDTYKRPALVSCNYHGKIKGSGRSACGFKLYDYLMGFPEEFFYARGGHDEALGFELDPNEHENFRNFFFNTTPTVNEFIVYYHDLLDNVQSQFQSVLKDEPYGNGFEKPQFLCDHFTVTNKRKYGDNYYGKGLFRGVEYNFGSKVEIEKGLEIQGIVDLQKDKQGELRFYFVDYKVINKQ